MKQKSGLQKKVSSIFDGIQFPKNMSDKQTPLKESEKSPGDNKSDVSEINSANPQLQNTSSVTGEQKTGLNPQKVHAQLKNIYPHIL